MQAEAVFTGSELLLGYVINTHAHFLGLELAKLGVELTLQTAVGDDWDRMRSVIKQALKRSDIVITTGGLGPTTDDITKEVIADILGVPMVMNAEALSKMQAFFDKRGRPMPAIFRRQACFPAGARLIPNDKGTAPGCFLEHDNTVIIVLPGPPRELRHMFTTYVAPFIAGLPGRGEVLRTKTLKLTGIAEYAVQEILRDLGGQGNPGLGYLAKPGATHVRVTARHADPQEAERMVEELAQKVVERLGDHLFAIDDQLLERDVGAMLREKGMTISTAESCTAGMVAARLTDVPGSSRYFYGGAVTYSNELKTQMLGVPAETIARYGAVSEETAVAMAQGVRRLTGSDIGIGVTGIAGPDGGSPGKPVGLVYIALASDKEVVTRRYFFPGERMAVREGTVNAALHMVKVFLENH